MATAKKFKRNFLSPVYLINSVDKSGKPVLSYVQTYVTNLVD